MFVRHVFKFFPGLVLAFFGISCQDLPEKYRGDEGKKLLDRYRKQVVMGVVDIAENLKGKIPEKPFFLIISVKSPDDPMPIAVVRVRNPEFPYRFKVTGKNKIRTDKFIEGDIILSVRVSKNPSATVSPGDLVGTAQAAAGDKDVRIILAAEVGNGE